MDRTEIYSKETLLVYLINELSKGNFLVTTVLDDEGCWTGEIHIKETPIPNNDDDNYYLNLAKNIEKTIDK